VLTASIIIVVVRFKLSETLNTGDSNLVLEALERGLAPVSKQIVRSGNELTARGIGPSPRTMNPNDTTIIHVTANDGITRLAADVTYQASALLGGTSQDDIVREKIDRVVEQIRADLKYVTHATTPFATPPALPPVRIFEDSRTFPASEAPALPMVQHWPEPPSHPSALTSQPNGRYSRLLEEAPSPPEPHPQLNFELHPWPAPEPASNPLEPQIELSLEPFPVQIEEHFEPIPVQIAEHFEPFPFQIEEHFEPIPEPILPRYPYGEPATAPIEQAPHELEHHPAPLAPVFPIRRAVAAKSAKLARRRKSTNSRILALAVLLVLATLAAGAYYRPDFYLQALQIISTPLQKITAYINNKPKQRLNQTAHQITPPSSSQVESPGSSLADVPKAIAPTSALPDATPKNLPTDLRDWLQSWGAALQSTDAVRQASFYADPVDHYFLHPHVSRGAILIDKQVDIDSRDGPITLRLDDIEIARENTSSALVLLIKRISSQDRKHPNRSIPTQLVIKRINGVWQITSEWILK
jgi:hypothetical protein